jgi:AraC-like DNA-binding protein
MMHPSLGRAARRWSSPSPSAHPADHPVLLLRPPYRPEDVCATTPDLGNASTPGAILGVHVRRAAFDPHSLRALTRDLSARTSSCPVVLLLDLPPEQGLAAAARLAPFGFRAVVPHGRDMSAALREALTDPAALPQTVVKWLRLRSIRLNPNLADLIEHLLAAAPEHADATRLLDAHRIPQATARWRLRKRGLPPPSRWFQVGRALHAALRLQAQPEASTTDVARRLGFADHSALIHLFRRSFGVGAGEIRGTFGWEWLLARWLSSARAQQRKLPQPVG